MNKIIKIDAERGSELHNRLIQLSVQTTRNFFEFGAILKEIRDKALWLALGYDSFQSYFADPDLSLSKSSVYNAIYLVEHFPDWKNMVPVPVSKLTMIAPHLDEKNTPKLLEYAIGLSRSDLRHQLDNMGLKSDYSESEMPKIYGCKDCGRVKGVFFDDLCQCGLTVDQILDIKDILKRREEGGV
jgi:hypothetical protein